MLFANVQGPELEAIYCYLLEQTSRGQTIPLTALYDQFVACGDASGQASGIQHVIEAVCFLKSAGLVKGSRNLQAVPPRLRGETFRLWLLRNLKARALGHGLADPVDQLYWRLLDTLFVRPEIIHISDLYRAVNQLPDVQALGGLSQIQTHSWASVMAFLGVGQIVKSGFLCAYSPHLVHEIVTCWYTDQAPLWDFLEGHFEQFLPCWRQDGKVANLVRVVLDHLRTQCLVEFLPLPGTPPELAKVSLLDIPNPAAVLEIRRLP